MAKAKKNKVNKVKKSSKFGIAKFLVMALVLGGGLIYGIQMVQKNQENRSSAAARKQVCICSKPAYKTAYLCGKNKGKWICKSVIPTNKPTATPVSKKTCTTGEKLCKGNVLMICKNNRWTTFRTCDNGCGNEECMPKIISTPTPIKKLTITPIQKKCTSVIYSAWSSCKDGKQVRSIWEKNPSGCVVDNPVLSQSCSNF